MTTLSSAGTGRIRRRAALAAGVGNFMEWFDFAVYGFFAPTMGKVFFPDSSATVGLLSSLAVFGVAFFFRPVGGFVLGSLGDRRGRRFTLSLSVLMMGVTTTLIAALPSYHAVGVLAPVLLVVLRCLQGFSAGGEWTGSAAFLLEITPSSRRGVFGSVISATAALATVAGSFVALLVQSLVSAEDMLSWGWRIPFLIAAPLALIGLYVRLKLDETPVFEELKALGKVSATPLRSAGKRNLKPVLLTLAIAAVQGLGFYYLATYVVNYLSQTVHLSRTNSLVLSAIGLTVYMALCPLAGAISDRYGRRRVNLAGSIGYVVLGLPAFVLMGQGGVAPVLLGMLLLVVPQSLVSVTTVVMLVELFPAATRSSGSATGFNIALAFIAGPGPFVASAIASATGSSVWPASYMVLVALVATVFLAKFLPETAGRDIGAEAPAARVEAH
ncbi:MFS transporter [Amycolatopsis sacchari]|uniref:Putative proline/betaine transporter n=1 Tax=Amycolatopsis sacchari TaxID=115433 RepID=A0A1I3R6S2_9PSEU|nr:MFS transporter [Amycolatopsis sacchari]SFJ41047.1 MFS transporter, MHS family, proline/betaine transporter [Amycolatopsis sacchari]